MRKRFSILFAVICLLITALFNVEAAENNEKDVLAVFSVKPEFTSDMIKIKLSDISEGNNMDFSYNTDTGFIYAEDDSRSIFIKEMDDNIEVTEEALILKRIEEIDLYLQYNFNVYVYINGKVNGLEGAEALTARVSVDFMDGNAYFSASKYGTSSNLVNSENVDGILSNNLLLVNSYNTLDSGYFPADMVYAKPSRGRAAVNVRLNKEAMENLNSMLDAAFRDGVSGMVITSAFRTFEKQTSLFNNKTNILSRKMNRKNAMEEASKTVAVPGTSEHQTGLAADICSEGTGLISNFAYTKQGKWLKDNSWKFGYIIRYPEDKTEVTGIIYEPWHLRYVGSGHAEFMKTKGMSFEEYVEYLKKNGIIMYSDSSGSSYAVHYIDKQKFTAGGLKIRLPKTSAWSISNCTRDSYILTVKL